MQVSILHPLATLDWEESTSLPELMWNSQCVLLNSVLYVGGGKTRLQDSAKLFISNSATEHLVWDVCRTPTEGYALTTYHSQLVLVGGRGPFNHEPSNKLWTLSSDAEMNWQPSIQEMPTKRWGASAMNIGTPEYLVVAGGVGVDDSELDTVEVFTGKEWCTVEPLPEPCSYLKWALHEGKYYLFDSYRQSYSCDIKLFLKSCEKSCLNMRQFPLWSQSKVPLKNSSPASFGQHLISTGGRSSDMFALSPLSQSWVHVGKLPATLSSAASIVLPTGELVVIGARHGGLTYNTCMFVSTLRGEFNS